MAAEYITRIRISYEELLGSDGTMQGLFEEMVTTGMQEDYKMSVELTAEIEAAANGLVYSASAKLGTKLSSTFSTSFNSSRKQTKKLVGAAGHPFYVYQAMIVAYSSSGETYRFGGSLRGFGEPQQLLQEEHFDAPKIDEKAGGPSIQYGALLKLKNQYIPKNGFLDACGHSGRGGFGVETSPNPNRDGGSGTWQIVAADMSSSGALSYGDTVKLINQYDASKGFLDTCGHSGRGGFGVETSPNPNRDGGSGTWQIVAADMSSSGAVSYGDMVKLINQYDASKGFLDACGHSGRGGYGVETSPNPGRDGGSGTWELVKNF